jgi:hypothetical protein
MELSLNGVSSGIAASTLHSMGLILMASAVSYMLITKMEFLSVYF